MAATIYILNGPNLNLLGKREPDVYGSETLADIERRCRKKADALGLSVELRQSNIEGELVGWIQEARERAQGILINAAAYTHTSVALHDALKACGLPIVEVHLSNIYKREAFRHNSFVSPVANGVICGFGGQGYEFALDALAAIVHRSGK
ncbi:MAG TPA: type II 3-dehydroquinate dehydratase [Aestuariivirgaceae bacterium]|jgi:3-dehydroquinate dehydratase-2